MTYAAEAAALDAAVLDVVSRRDAGGFGDLALRIFAHQLTYNKPYARYCAALGVTLDSFPSSWERIVPVPAEAYKELALCTFSAAQAALCFESSGTLRGQPSRHYMETTALYDAVVLAGFSSAIVTRSAGPMRYVLLVPNPEQRPQSSFGYMMRLVARRFGDGKEIWCVDGDTLHAQRAIEVLRNAGAEQQPVCVAATAFSLVALLHELAATDEPLQLPAGSVVMPTGGFKGRTRAVSRDDLYASLCEGFGVRRDAIVGEYGMAELSSQYYEDTGGILRPPPWLRVRVVDEEGADVPAGTPGILVHVDLGNRSSCIAVQTQDAGIATGDGGFVLLGRAQGAELRGCSLDAESLIAR